MSLRDAEVVCNEEVEALDAAFAERAVDAVISDLRVPEQRCVIGVSGGSVGERVFPALIAAGNARGIDWSRVDIVFADERFAPRGSDERNATAIMAALRHASGFDPVRLHMAAPSDAWLTLDEAATDYARQLGVVLHERDGRAHPIDLLLLGMGPDGHTASLFPGFPQLGEQELQVAAVRDSPKPPPERVTITMPLIHSSRRVWVYATGEGKREALTKVFHGASIEQVPVGAVAATEELVLWLDRDAVPENLPT